MQGQAEQVEPGGPGDVVGSRRCDGAAADLDCIVDVSDVTGPFEPGVQVDAERVELVADAMHIDACSHGPPTGVDGLVQLVQRLVEVVVSVRRPRATEGI